MQTASANFAAAVSASSGVWAPPQIHADWANDGYGGDTSIDNLSDLDGRPITITQVLDDGMPSDISATTSQDPVSQVQFPGGGRITGGVNFTGPQYWSVDNSASPIASYDRDVAALTVAHGLVTSGGIERVTVFTGQMSDAQVTGKAVTVTGQSKTRLALTKTVQPAPIIGDWMGLDATWPVSWALAQCGVYVSPPPRSGCRLWVPMHGSIQPFLPNTGRKSINSVVGDVTGGNPNVRPSFVDGPYLAALNVGRVASNPNRLNWGGLPVAAGTDLLSKAANAGRVEFWVRGDTVDNTLPSSPTYFVYVLVAPGAPTLAYAGVDTNRKVFVRVNDGTNDITYTSSSTVPTDGAWYFIGAAWDVANKKLWVDFNGTVSSSTFSALTTSTLVTADGAYNPDLTSASSVQLFSVLPIAEVQLTSGAQANPDNFVWINDVNYAWTAGAVLNRSSLQLVGLAEQKPREAWEFISSFAQAELATIRTDELDRFTYYPLSYWAKTAQQTTSDAWSTALNASSDFQVTKDPSKIRNQVALTYTDSRLGHYLLAQDDTVCVDFTQRTFPPGTTKFTLQFGSPVARVENQDGDPAGTVNMLLIDGTYTAPPVRSYLSANTATDGSGTYATVGQLVATISRFDAGSCDITIVNTTNTTFYAIHSTLAYVQIVGTFLTQVKTASVTVNDTVSQSARGVRGLSLSLPAITDATTATWVANAILTMARLPRKVLTATLRGDPRRQPGDLVTFADATNTKLAGTWRVMSIRHNIDGPNYTQDVIAAQYWPVAVWDQTNWDQSVWGP